MKTWPVIILAATVALLVRVSVSAHHGGAAFDNGKTVVLKGTVVEWIYSNPHCLLKLDVKGADVGAMMWAHLPYSVVQHRALAGGELPYV